MNESRKVKESMTRPLPAELRDRILPLVNRLSFLVPPWITEIYVCWNRDVEMMECASMKDYLWIDITCGRSCLTSDEDELENAVIHEICHAYTTPLVVLARDMLDDLSPLEAYKKTVGRIIDHELEMSTEALTQKFQEILASNDRQNESRCDFAWKITEGVNRIMENTGDIKTAQKFVAGELYDREQKP